MTPAQIDRAVRAALLDVLPPIVARLREELAAAMARNLAPAEAAQFLPPSAPRQGPAEGTPAIRMTDEQVARIHGLADEGLGNPAIAAAVGCSLPTVRARLKQRGGVAAPNPSARSRRLSREEVAEIWRQHDAGRTIGQIAEGLGASWATVQHRLSQPRPEAVEVPAPASVPVPVPPPEVVAMPATAPEEPVILPEAIVAAMDVVEDWLWDEMRRQGRADASFEARVLAMESRVLLNTANAQRRLLGLPPFAVAERVQGRAA